MTAILTFNHSVLYHLFLILGWERQTAEANAGESGENEEKPLQISSKFTEGSQRIDGW